MENSRFGFCKNCGVPFWDKPVCIIISPDERDGPPVFRKYSFNLDSERYLPSS